MANRFPLEYIGNGFIPSTEGLRGVIIDTTKEKLIDTVIGGNTWALPENIQYINEVTVFHKTVTAESRFSYAREKKAEYGLGPYIHLVIPMDIASNGRWIEDASNSMEDLKILNVFVKTLGIFQILDPIKFVSTQVSQELSNLPTMYTESTKDKFITIMGKYGTHVIIEQQIGGSIDVETTVQRSKFTSSSLAEISESISWILGDINGSVEEEKGKHAQSEYRTSKLQINGGNISGLNTVEDLTSENFTAWSDSIVYLPKGMLMIGLKLFPLYGLTVEPQASCLRKATIEFLGSKWENAPIEAN